MRPANLDGLGFRFKIGDVVIHKGLACRLAMDAAAAAKGTEDAPTPQWFDQAYSMENITRIVIVERMGQECPGGVQLKYVAVACDHNGDVSNPHVFLEEELAPLPPA